MLGIVLHQRMTLSNTQNTRWMNVRDKESLRRILLNSEHYYQGLPSKLKKTLRITWGSIDCRIEWGRRRRSLDSFRWWSMMMYCEVSRRVSCYDHCFVSVVNLRMILTRFEFVINCRLQTIWDTNVEKEHSMRDELLWEINCCQACGNERERERETRLKRLLQTASWFKSNYILECIHFRQQLF